VTAAARRLRGRTSSLADRVRFEAEVDPSSQTVPVRLRTEVDRPTLDTLPGRGRIEAAQTRAGQVASDIGIIFNRLRYRRPEQDTGSFFQPNTETELAVNQEGEVTGFVQPVGEIEGAEIEAEGGAETEQGTAGGEGGDVQERLVATESGTETETVTTQRPQAETQAEPERTGTGTDRAVFRTNPQTTQTGPADTLTPELPQVGEGATQPDVRDAAGQTDALGPELSVFGEVDRGIESVVEPALEFETEQEMGAEQELESETESEFEQELELELEQEQEQEIEQELELETEQEQETEFGPLSDLTDAGALFGDIGTTEEEIITNFVNPLTGDVLRTEDGDGGGGGVDLPGFGGTDSDDSFPDLGGGLF